MKRLQKLQLGAAFDPVNPESRPTEDQQAIFNDLEDIPDAGRPGIMMPKVQFRFVIAGNQSGKSSLAAREIAWIVNDTHPTWKRPARWGEEPLLILIAGQDRKQMEIELWSKKIKPFLEPADWNEKRVAGILNYAEHRKFGHKIVFLSHNDSSESNRQHMQGYVAHYVWLDEMPRHISILEELQRRVDSRGGYLIATFTPKFRNEAIKKVVDAAVEPIGKRYRLSKLDNPLVNKTVELQKMAGYSDSLRKTILYGDWFTGDNAVYSFDTTMEAPEIPGYHASWRHVCSVDPAMRSKCGVSIWAEDPGTGTWFLIKDEYVVNILSPDDVVTAVIQQAKGLNIVKWVVDPHEPWFIGYAQKLKLKIEVPQKKDRKEELIKGLQYSLSAGKIKIASWCKNFIDEINSCQWSETSDRIINSSKFHILDTAQYFVDLMPPYDESNRVMPWAQELRVKNEERKAKARQAEKLKIVRTGPRRTHSAWRRFAG